MIRPLMTVIRLTVTQGVTVGVEDIVMKREKHEVTPPLVDILGKRDLLGSGELLFQVTGDSLLLFPSEAVSVLTRPCLVQGLPCCSHDSNESLLLSVHSSDGGLSYDSGIILLPLGGNGRRSGLLPIYGEEVGVATWHSRQHGGG
jgi:hypothetical protein